MAGAFDMVNRRAVRAPVNPMDKSTLVSILPFMLDERKPTIFPGRFQVPAGTYEAPGVLTIGPSSWWKETDVDQPLLEIPVSSFNVAESIVRDFCNSQLGCDNSKRVPGIFFILGEKDSKTIVKDHKKELDVARDKQKEWYLALVKIADTLWARTQGNPLAITNTARQAAINLGLDKPWMQDFKTMQMENCPACGTLRQNLFPVCANCKTVLDMERYKKLGLAVAS